MDRPKPFRLLSGSPAIGAGTTVSGVTTDQRGLIRGGTVDIGAFQTSLVVESTSASLVTTAAGLTLPGAVSLANQFAGSAITFDPAVFATRQTITLTSGQLTLGDAYNAAADFSISANPNGQWSYLYDNGSGPQLLTQSQANSLVPGWIAGGMGSTSPTASAP